MRSTIPSAPTSTYPALDLAAVGELSFETPDEETFPCLRLAREAGAAGGTAPAVLNAANEVAVEAFLAGEIPFTAIPEVGRGDARGRWEGDRADPLDDLYAADAEARGARGQAGREAAGTRRELVPRLRRIFGVDHPARVRALRRREEDGMRVEKFYLFFPPPLLKRQAR